MASSYLKPGSTPTAPPATSTPVADAKDASQKKIGEQTSAEFAALVCSIVRVPNPQFDVNGKPGETALAQHICAWLEARSIKYECDLTWGIHAVLTGPEGAGKPGVLLAAHMDSDHLNLPDVNGVKVEGDKLLCPGQVGLDCKTGVAIALSVLERLMRGNAAGPAWQVHVLFTIGEEAGQKGAVRAPIGRLLAGKVKHGFVIDRMTNGSNAPRHPTTRHPLRHAVENYKGVPLLEPSSRDELLRHLNAGVRAADPVAAAYGPLPLMESPNNADALELRGRFDAEVIAPTIAKPSAKLKAALQQYTAATREVLDKMAKIKPEKRVSGMYAPPRSTRYAAMAAVYEALHGGTATFDERLAFSCVNLSYEYDDADPTCDLTELERTANLLLHTCLSYFGAPTPPAQMLASRPPLPEAPAALLPSVQRLPSHDKALLESA